MKNEDIALLLAQQIATLTALVHKLQESKEEETVPFTGYRPKTDLSTREYIRTLKLTEQSSRDVHEMLKGKKDVTLSSVYVALKELEKAGHVTGVLSMVPGRHGAAHLLWSSKGR